MREHATDQWYAVMPLSGGLLLLPHSLLRPLGMPTYDQFMQAVEMATPDGRRALASLFPRYVTIAAERAAQ